MKFGLTGKSYTLIIQTISRFPEIEQAVIFGSRAMGNEKKGSDVDIAVMGEEITAEMVTRLSALLNEETPVPYFIDVLHYNSLKNRELKKHIDEKGEVLWKRSLVKTTK